MYLEFPVSYPPLGKRVMRRQGVAYLEWDQTELRHIAELARRVPTEGVAAAAKDFWRRGIKDWRGRPWGEAKAQTVQSFVHPLPGILSGRAMVPPHKVERAATGPLRRPGGVDS